MVHERVLDRSSASGPAARRRHGLGWRVYLTAAWLGAIWALGSVELRLDPPPDGVTLSPVGLSFSFLLTAAAVCWTPWPPPIRLVVVAGTVGLVWTSWGAITDVRSLLVFVTTWVVHASWCLSKQQVKAMFARSDRASSS